MIAALRRTLGASLELVLLRRPDPRLRLRPAGQFWALAVLSLLLSVATSYLWTDGPVAWHPEGIASDAFYLLLLLAGAAWVAHLDRRPVLAFSLAVWWLAVGLWIGLIGALLTLGLDAWSGAPSAEERGYADLLPRVGVLLILLWWVLAILHSLAWLSGPSRAMRTRVWAVAVNLGPVLALMHGDWPDYFVPADTPRSVDEATGSPNRPSFDPETLIYAQEALLRRALQSVPEGEPGIVEPYVVAFGGDGHEPVFGNEVEYVGRLFAARFGAGRRVVTLSNDPRDLERFPLATRTALERVLYVLGRRMDPGEDILVLFLTSHGTEDHRLAVQRAPLPLNAIAPEELRRALDRSGIRHRVILVSACYSGGFLPLLANDDSLVITAARRDRPSFGCGPDAELTYFGEAYFHHALNRTGDLIQAFELARARIAEREKAAGHPPSEPQIAIRTGIRTQLARWTEGRVLGPPLPFVPGRGCTAGSAAAPCAPP